MGAIAFVQFHLPQSKLSGSMQLQVLRIRVMAGVAEACDTRTSSRPWLSASTLGSHRATLCAAAVVVAALLLAGGTGFARARSRKFWSSFAYGTRLSVHPRGAGRRAAGGPRQLAARLPSRNLGRTLRELRAEAAMGLPLRVILRSLTWTTDSDADGYFALRGDTPSQARPGWNPLLVEAADGTARADAELLSCRRE